MRRFHRISASVSPVLGLTRGVLVAGRGTLQGWIARVTEERQWIDSQMAGTMPDWTFAAGRRCSGMRCLERKCAAATGNNHLPCCVFSPGCGCGHSCAYNCFWFVVIYEYVRVAQYFPALAVTLSCCQGGVHQGEGLARVCLTHDYCISPVPGEYIAGGMASSDVRRAPRRSPQRGS